MCWIYGMYRICHVYGVKYDCDVYNSFDVYHMGIFLECGFKDPPSLQFCPKLKYIGNILALPLGPMAHAVRVY